MRKIYYTRDTGKSGGQEYFAKISQGDRQHYHRTLNNLLYDILEHSTIDDRLWREATTAHKNWGRGRWHGYWCANTMLSVMGGLLRKISHADFTAKQVENSNVLFTVIAHMVKEGMLTTTEPFEQIQFEEDLRQDQKTKIRAKLFSE